MDDISESAMWLTGMETPDQLADVKKAIRTDFSNAQEMHGVLFGPIEYRELHPIDDGCPVPPDWCRGPDVRILVGEAKVLCKAPRYAPADGFSKLLDTKTLLDMRAATRRAHKSVNPRGSLTDDQCDAMIDEIGPHTAETKKAT